MFNILKNLLSDGNKEVTSSEQNINKIDSNIQKSEKCIAPVVNKIKSSSDNIDIFKVSQCSPLDNEVTEYAVLSPINQELFNLMKDQLKEKDLQIRKLSELLDQGQNLHKNTQILSKNQQSGQGFVSLEDDLDSKLKNSEINMTEHKKQEHKGFFGILFEK